MSAAALTANVINLYNAATRVKATVTRERERMNAAEANLTTIIAVSLAGGWTQAALEGLAERFAADSQCVWLVPDLYHIPEDSPLWHELDGDCPAVRVVSRLHPRAAEWVLRKRLPGLGHLSAFRIDDFPSPEALLAAAADQSPGPGDQPGQVIRHLEKPSARWYPVRDASRCTHCGHCVQFCLFGVWERDASGQVRVAAPDACKDGCPACARICPRSAIIFPEYLDDPAICGVPGCFVEPDPAARRMYYVRTGTPCPLCGQTGKSKGVGKGSLCAECGRRVPEAAAEQDRRPGLSDIDALIDDLEHLQDRSG